MDDVKDVKDMEIHHCGQHTVDKHSVWNRNR